jgi:MbtH protein
MFDGADTIFKVLVNHEEQYSIWPQQREAPAGWSEVGVSGSKDECLAHIDEVWTDMRPRSLRQQMAADGSTD